MQSVTERLPVRDTLVYSEWKEMCWCRLYGPKGSPCRCCVCNEDVPYQSIYARGWAFHSLVSSEFLVRHPLGQAPKERPCCTCSTCRKPIIGSSTLSTQRACDKDVKSGDSRRKTAATATNTSTDDDNCSVNDVSISIPLLMYLSLCLGCWSHATRRGTFPYPYPPRPPLRAANGFADQYLREC